MRWAENQRTDGVVDAFSVAGAATAGVVGSPEVASAWDGPSALAGYRVGELAAHTLLATARLEAVLGEAPLTEPTVVDLAGFYGPNRVDDAGIDAGLHPLIRAAAADAAGQGPDAVATELRAVLDRLRAVLPTADPARLVSVVNVRHGATALETYLRTRVVELVVHGDDLAASVGLPYVVPPAAAEVTLEVCLELARARSGELAVLRAFTRRERADPDTLRVL
jgi:uncharacterized protein (TIGR03083 family)